MSWYENKIKKHEDHRSFKAISDIRILYPYLCFLILKLFINAYKEGLKICIFETYRSQERQLDLFNKKRTKVRENGMHHFGIAVDIVFRNEKNYPIWQGDWDKLGKIGKALGLIWGGDWGWDKPHFQLIDVKDQAKIIKGNYPSYDDQVDDYLDKMIPCYEAVKNSNYSEESIKKLLDCYDSLFKIPTKEKEESLNRWKRLWKFLISFFIKNSK